jgi:hypothetical protein
VMLIRLLSSERTRASNSDTKTPTRKINLYETSVYDFIQANMHEVDINGSVDNDVVVNEFKFI